MTDVYDKATDIEMRERELSLAIVRAQASKPALKPIGHCYNCDEVLTGSVVFCDEHCRDDWQLRLNRKK